MIEHTPIQCREDLVKRQEDIEKAVIDVIEACLGIGRYRRR